MKQLTDKEAEHIAEQLFLDTYGEVIAPWRDTWAEHVVRLTRPEPIVSQPCPVSVWKAVASGPKDAEALLVDVVWGMLTEEARKVYGTIFTKMMEGRNEKLREFYFLPEESDGQVSRAIAMIAAASNVRWNRWYPADSQFHIEIEPVGENINVIGWMWPT